jgi:uncharacterized membrane protein (Fun14 family)
MQNLLAMSIVHSTSITNSTIAAAKLGITLPKSIVQKIDNKRADIPRSRYIRRAIEKYLGSSKDIETQPKKEEIAKKMSGIESSIMPLVSTVGFGGIVGFLVGFALKRIMKIPAVIAGVFFAALLYLESQHIVNVNWDKSQTISNSVLSTITTTVTNGTTTGGGVGMGSIQSILGNNSTAAANAILPITSPMANLGIPLTGSTAMGFTNGLFKG